MSPLLRALFGPLLWAAHFSLLYLIHTLLCVPNLRLSDPTGAMLAASVLLTAPALALLAWLFIANWRGASRERAKRSEDAFLDEASLLLTVLSAAGVLWAGAAASFIDACAPVR